jgi:protoporphyrinogen oxidase
MSRIYYDGKFFSYPIRPLNALAGLGPIEAVRIGVSYLWARLAPHSEERNFEQWVSNRFGSRLYEIFFKTYTEKVWGIPCTEISADWAAQRIKNLDLVQAVRNALLGSMVKDGEVISSLIDEFQYPRLGPGMMWEALQNKLEHMGVPTTLGASVEGIKLSNGRVAAAMVKHADGRTEEVAADHILSSMPLRELLHALDPAPPESIMAAARNLRYRDFLTVVLIVRRPDLFPDNWIYIHSPDVKVGRIQNFKNWSPEMVPDPSMTAIGLEYFGQEGDPLWSTSEEDLIELGGKEVAALGLVEKSEIENGTVVRMPKAYPVYDGDYKEALQTVTTYVAGIEGLESIGRNGQHRYNNQDHSMVTGIYAARNIAGAAHDAWSVNVDQEYHEEVGKPKPAVEDRLVPERVDRPELEELLRKAFGRYDPVALGVSVGTIAGIGLFLATAILLVKGGDPVGPNLSLLANYFMGFDVSWNGAFIAFVEAAIGGYVLGDLMARSINLFIHLYERSIRRRFQLDQVLVGIATERP